MEDLISRQAVLDKAYELDLSDTGNDIRVWVVDVAEVEKLPTAEPEYEGKGFLEFLWNVINPNEMEKYLAMYSSKGVSTDG